MFKENPRLKVKQAIKDDLQKMTSQELVNFNYVVLTSNNFDDDSEVTKLIEKYLPNDDFYVSLIFLTKILLDVTSQKLLQKS